MTQSKIVMIALFMLLVTALATVTTDRKVRARSQFLQEQVIYLDQGWSKEDRQAFYHTPHGTRLIPYRWLLALEAPDNPKPFLTEERIRRYRLIPDRNSLNNPDHLPVGFAKEVATDGEFVSVTCAACHTGQISFTGVNLRIDGGPSMNDLNGFIASMYASLTDTYGSRLTFQRFATRVLGQNATPNDQSKLQGEVRKAFFTNANAMLNADLKGVIPTEEGFGRLDALGRSGNQILATAIGDERNIATANAPVGFPHLWGTPFFDSLQWNGAITQPLARNILETLGLGAQVTLKGDQADLFKSSVNIRNLFLLDEMLKQLRPPPWPEQVLGVIEKVKAAKGRVLYNQHCASCHESKKTAPNEFGKTFLQIKMVELPEIGTDRKAAENFNNRAAYAGQLSQPPFNLTGRLKVTRLLQEITTLVAERKFKELNVPLDMQNQINGYRKNVIHSTEAYRARNMDGIWATAPYLHNNSVPNMYQLLLPAAQRDKTFYVGSLQYDPKVLGFDTVKSADGFELRTNIPGNSNAGHEFRDGPPGKGIIGPMLTDNERWAIIEYLKTR